MITGPVPVGSPINEVPVGAVVPQFYGYYVPDDPNQSTEQRFLSPILLLEHCGVSVDPLKLNADDKCVF